MSVVAIAGELDRTNSTKLADFLDQVHRPGEHVVFDLTELAFLDSSGLHILLAQARTCTVEGAGAHLAGAAGATARLLTITGVETRLPTYATVEEAITTVLAARQR